MGKFTKYKFDLNMAHPRNFLYKKSINPATDIQVVHYTEEQIQKYAEYIERILTSLPDDKRRVMVTVYGGDFLKEISGITKFVEALKTAVDWFFLSIPPTGIQNYTDGLYNLSHACDSKLAVDIECTAEDLLTPSEFTVDSIIYNIRWLFGRNLGGYVKVFISSVDSIPAVFDVYTNLVQIVPNVRFELMLDYTADIDVTCNEGTLEALEAIASILKSDPVIRKNFAYSPPQGVRTGQLPKALFGNIMSVMTEGGVIYPGYDVSMITDKAVDDLAIGTVDDDISDIIGKRNTLLRAVPVKYDYTNVDNLYRVTPWDDKDGVGYNMIPTESAKQLHNILVTYLSTRGV